MVSLLHLYHTGISPKVSQAALCAKQFSLRLGFSKLPLVFAVSLSSYLRFHSARICGFTRISLAPSSLDDPALHEDLSLPERHKAGLLRLLLVTHVAVNLRLEVEPGGGRVSVLLK